MTNMNSTKAVAEEKLKEARKRLQIQEVYDLEEFDIEKAEEHTEKALKAIKKLKKAVQEDEII